MPAEMNFLQAMASSPVLIALVLCSVVTLGVTLERVHYFSKRRGEADGLLRDVLDMIKEGNLSEAVRRCRAHTHPLGAVAVEVLQSAHESPTAQEERLQIGLSQQKLLLERNLGVIGTAAAVAPLVGLLGTVWGIMRAFNDMALTGSAAPSVVAAGVAEALVTTAAGLVVAVPSVVLYNHFSRKMSVMLTVAENHSRTIRTVLGESPLTDPSTSQRVVPVHAGSNGPQGTRPMPQVKAPESFPMDPQPVQSK